jgi:hypothetical protein
MQQGQYWTYTPPRAIKAAMQYQDEDDLIVLIDRTTANTVHQILGRRFIILE